MSNVRMFSLSEIVSRLQDRNLTVVARRTGVPYGNLRLLANGKTKAPNYMDVDRLREYLSSE